MGESGYSCGGSKIVAPSIGVVRCRGSKAKKKCLSLGLPFTAATRGCHCHIRWGPHFQSRGQEGPSQGCLADSKCNQVHNQD